MSTAFASTSPPRSAGAAAAKPAPAPPRDAPRPFPAKLQRELDRLPERMTAIEQEIATLELQLDDPDFYTRDPGGFAFIGEKLASLRGVLASHEDRWLELEALREAHSA